MSLIDNDEEVRAVMNEWIRRSLAPSKMLKPKRAPGRFWDHFSFCATLFWALRKMKHLRAGQLLGIILAKENPPNIQHDADLAYNIFRKVREQTGDERVAFHAQIKDALTVAERAYMLSRTEDDHLSYLIEDYVMNQQNHCDSK